MCDDEQRLESEYWRLSHGAVSASSGDLGVSAFRVDCRDNAEAVAKKTREVLLRVNRSTVNDAWPNLDSWRSLLPEWFVKACKPERTAEEAERYLAWWDSLSDSEKNAEAKRPQTWTLSNWIAYFDPEQRQWYWWSDKVCSDDKLLIFVQVRGHPFPSGALEWLLRAAGAERVEEMQE